MLRRMLKLFWAEDESLSFERMYYFVLTDSIKLPNMPAKALLCQGHLDDEMVTRFLHKG